MKILILTISLLFLGTNFGMATPHPTKQITRYKLAQKQTIELPTNFAKPFIIDQKDIDLLAGKTIHHVELVYTKYAESASFNQKALNFQRISQLKKLLPQINSDNPAWTWLEQTGATTREVASNYFHGFVIHYGEKLDHTVLGQFFSGVSSKAKQFDISASSGGTFKHYSGTSIHVPANSVAYKNGKVLTGNFTLLYTEYRNPAEIALSGLPMLYKGDNFSSIGMYELRGEKDGEELKLIKPIAVDFNCTKIVDDAAFFSMDDATGEWKKEKDLEFPKQDAASPKEVLFTIESNDAITKVTSPLSSPIIKWKKIDKKTTRAILDSTAWKAYKGLKESNQPQGIISKDAVERSFVIDAQMRKTFQQKILNQHYYGGSYDDFWGAPVTKGKTKGGGKVKNQTPSPLSAGHTYPALVSGLRSPKFGVYNCDQVYRMSSIARLNPVYMDINSKKSIDNGFVACVIDLSKNGSFSFHPNNLTVSKNGRTTVLLFTADKEIYLIDEREFSMLDLEDRHTLELPMKNVTSMLKSPSDLKKLLNI